MFPAVVRISLIIIMCCLITYLLSYFVTHDTTKDLIIRSDNDSDNSKDLHYLSCQRSTEYTRRVQEMPMVPDKEFDPRQITDRQRFLKETLPVPTLSSEYSHHTPLSGSGSRSGSKSGPARTGRYIIVDVGARNPLFKDSFLRYYFNKKAGPLPPSLSFDIYSFECDVKFHHSIRKAVDAFPPHKITLVPHAAYIREGKMEFSGDMGHLHLQNNSMATASNAKSRVVETIDFSEWLETNVHEDDFVVVKLDVEEAEYAILDRLLTKGTLCLVDELYMEVHFNRRQRTSPERQNRSHTWADVMRIGNLVSKSNTYYHLWF